MLGTDAGSLAVVIEYYDGTTWSTLSTATDGTSALVATGTIDFTAPLDWAKTTVSTDTSSRYYIRIRLSAGSYTAVPKVAQIHIDDQISTEINQRSVKFEDWGEVTFISNNVIGGTRNIKARYTIGKSSVPKLIRQTTAAIAGMAAIVGLMGGTFDDVTAYTIPEMSVSKGEPFTNMRATLVELNKAVFGSPKGERGRYHPGYLELLGREIKIGVS